MGADRGGRRWRQYLAVITVNGIAFVSGSAYGWPAPMLPLLQSEETPLSGGPITAFEACWLVSVMTATRLVSIPAYMWVHDRLGRKPTGYLIAGPFALSWCVLLVAHSASLLFWARFLTGLASGGIPLLVSSYTIDVAEDDIKGQLGVLYTLLLDLGITFSYVMGYYTPYTVFQACCLLLPLVFLATFYWLPESPVFLMTQGKAAEAKEALLWLRNGQECDYELERIRLRAHDVLEKRNKKFKTSDVADRATMRALLINLGLNTNKFLCGITALISYTVTIFKGSGSSISPNVATIIVGCLLVVGSLLSTAVVERTGRRPLLVYTNMLLAACLAVLGCFFYLKSCSWDLQYAGWVPLACLSVYNLVHGMALSPLPSTLVTEMVSVHARGAVQSLCTFYGSLLSFAVVATFTPLCATVGEHGCLWLYAGVCVLGSVCVFLTVPETKGRSLEDVIEQLAGDGYVRSVLRWPRRDQHQDTKHP